MQALIRTEVLAADDADEPAYLGKCKYYVAVCSLNAFVFNCVCCLFYQLIYGKSCKFTRGVVQQLFSFAFI